MKQKLKEKKIYLIYTGLFILIALIVFSAFIVNKRTFIWNIDGLQQHFITLRNFNEIIRNFLANPSGGIDLFSWNMGLGLDVIGQYSYYIIGDPFAYLSLLFPIESLESAYNFLVILRMFFIGISFIFYGRYNKNKDTNVLLGAIIYTFSSFALYGGVRHPYFLNAMIIFPMLLLGIDKLLKENKISFLTVWVAISAISNYYFFYMHTVMIVIYAIIKYLCEYRKDGVKGFFKKLGKAIVAYIIGILIAGIILLPTIYAFLNSARSGETAIKQYSLEYYTGLFSISLLTSYGKNWSVIGVSSLILLMLPVLWVKRKQHFTYFIYLLIGTIILLIPFLGSVMNGFSFPNNRWSFIYSFILAYIITLCFEEKYSKREMNLMTIFLVLYSVLAVIAVLYLKNIAGFTIYLAQIIVSYIMLLIFYMKYNKEESTQKDNYTNKNIMLKLVEKINKCKITNIILILVIINITITAYGLYTSYDRNYASEFIKQGEYEEELSTQLGKNREYKQAIQKIKKADNNFYRISKTPHNIQNLSTYYKYPSNESYLSIGNKYVYDLNKELADNEYTTTRIKGIGDRTKITTLLGTKYYVTDEKNEASVPYGYRLKEENDGVKTYENSFPLSIGVSYSKYLLREEYEKLNPIEKEQALLELAVIESNDLEKSSIKLEKEQDLTNIKDCYKDIQYKVIDNDNILKENKVTTTKKNQSIILEIPEVQEAEIYVYISNFSFNKTNEHKITAEFNGKSVNKLVRNKITSAYYQPTPEILLNLGYYDKAKGNIELKFSAKGNYGFDKIQVIAVPMKKYEEDVRNLRQNELKVVECDNKEIKGKVTLDKDSILQISTSYTIGWKAYVDGAETSTIPVNTAFIGIPVPKGEHDIYLKYEVPYLKVGSACTIVRNYRVDCINYMGQTNKYELINLGKN